MSRRAASSFDKFFEDRYGHLVIWQSPNVLLYGWAACKLIAFLLPPSSFNSGVRLLSTALLFTWAYLELIDGDSQFRKLLGLLVLLFIILSFFL